MATLEKSYPPRWAGTSREPNASQNEALRLRPACNVILISFNATIAFTH